MIKSKLKLFIPPIIMQLRRQWKKPNRSLIQSELHEKKSDWYDKVYESSEAYREHYTQSIYYALWTVLADRIQSAGVNSVLEIGCGPGQFAELLADRGIMKYCGFDFSKTAIKMARNNCAQYEFLEEDALKTDCFYRRQYDILVCTEVLEHVEEDRGLLQRIPGGVRFLGSVPNFASESHVRHFRDVSEVLQRYQGNFSQLTVIPHLLDKKGAVLFLMDGIVSE